MKNALLLLILLLIPLAGQRLIKHLPVFQKHNPGKAVESISVFTDARDGQQYRCVKIGEQVWMAQNLNYNIEGSYCYDNDPGNGKISGRLYTWEAALKACPEGWHLPSDEEWKLFEKHLGLTNLEINEIDYRGNEKKLKTQLEIIGFNITLTGCRTFHDGNFLGMGKFSFFWTSTSHKKEYAYKRAFDFKTEGIGRHTHNKKHANSVRCIRNK